jgi:succinate-semialdehyde dehydrogenase/glutarate-semialdehyde dehydrogenase
MAITAADERRVIDDVPRGLWIDGEPRAATGGRTFDVLDPATEEVLCAVADADAGDARAALGAAVRAQEPWAATPPRQRGEILRRAFELLVERAGDLALLMTLEMGKPVAESRAEVVYAAEFFRWFSEQAVRIDGRFSRDPAGRGRLITMKQPVGPCLLITPWNFPLAMGTRKIGPAVAAGCSMVVKPAQQTPLSTLALAAVMKEAGLPDGVLGVVPSSTAAETVGPLMQDPRLRKVSFTGSTPVGRSLVEQSAGQLLRVSMELGGNAPFVVFDDADLDAAVDGAVIAKMRNMGESCVAANRFHVQASVAAEFADRLAARLASLTVGRGTEEGVDVGPLITARQRHGVLDLLSDATSQGARVLTGGSAPSGAGYFLEPTVLTDVPGSARLLREELFGPVAPVVPFDSEDDGIAAANDTEYGLVAYVWSESLRRALRAAERVETGRVGVNTGLVSNPAAPFGGVKASGFGREGGPEGIEEYLSTKYVALAV